MIRGTIVTKITSSFITIRFAEAVIEQQYIIYCHFFLIYQCLKMSICWHRFLTKSLISARTPTFLISHLLYYNLNRKRCYILQACYQVVSVNQRFHPYSHMLSNFLDTQKKKLVIFTTVSFMHQSNSIPSFIVRQYCSIKTFVKVWVKNKQLDSLRLHIYLGFFSALSPPADLPLKQQGHSLTYLTMLS